METSIRYQENLCPICQGILLVRTSDASKGWVKATGQTLQIFREAVENKCIICSVIWYLSRQYRHLWSESPELWEPMNFWAHIDSCEQSIIKLHVLYNNPLKNETTEAKFRLISTNGMFQLQAIWKHFWYLDIQILNIVRILTSPPSKPLWRKLLS